MLTIKTADVELFNEADSTFTKEEGTTIVFEHSLASLSKWESIHQVPFLTGTNKTNEQALDYLRCMIINGASPDSILLLSQSQIDEVQAHIESNYSATTFRELPQRGGSKEVITSELIYYWMSVLNIPMECEHWHLNRLFALIKIANVKQSKQKKVPKAEIAQGYRDLNARRKAEIGTTG